MTVYYFAFIMQLNHVDLLRSAQGLIGFVLHQENKDPRGGFRDNREPNYRNRDMRREGRGGYYKVGHYTGCLTFMEYEQLILRS